MKKILALMLVLTVAISVNAETRRVPAEWETQTGIWMQWPKGYETSYQPDFCRIIDVLQEYETIHMIVRSISARNQAQSYILNQGVSLGNIEWHILQYNASWLRDNGPIYVIVDGEIVVQDWVFDAWGEQYPPWAEDDAIPCQIASILNLQCESFDLIVEKGNLEFNGAGAMIVSWPCQQNRNPDVSMAEQEIIFQDAFGVSDVIWLMSAPAEELTGGHTDGIARFINETTVAVVRYVDQNDDDAQVYEEAATIIANAGFNVERIDMPGYVSYSGTQLQAGYVNWLVTENAVIATGFNIPVWDNAAKARIEQFFPGRDVHVIDTREIWRWGGGVHCVTNDKPLLNISSVPLEIKTAKLLLNHPNPFNPMTTLSFDLPSDGFAKLEIVDATGSLIKVLINEFSAEGLHEVTWNGCNSLSQPMSSGVYYSRLSFNGEVDSGRVVLVR
ncbi:MAG: agmatine deiminase family protein [bacterium]|nr:agmatine deiminase family protein [bacterium]MCP4800900.1 agmatine deiminase family protein [bacterium]